MRNIAPILIPYPAIKGTQITSTGFTVWWKTEGSGHFIYIPAGTVTNGASVPRCLMWLWELLPESVRDAWLIAFVTHDRLVSEFGQPIPPIQYVMANGDIVTADPEPSRRVAARWMKRLIKQSDEVSWMRGPLYQAVRLWDRTRKLFV